MNLFLQFQIGNEGYLIDAARIACVLPMVEIRRMAHAPRAVSGAFEYGRRLVPVIDLSELTLGTPSVRRLSTRLILVSLAATEGGHDGGRDAPGPQKLLGLIAERATGLLRCEAAAFNPTGVCDAAPYLGPVTVVGGRLLQRIEVSQLLPTALAPTATQGPVDQDTAWLCEGSAGA